MTSTLITIVIIQNIDIYTNKHVHVIIIFMPICNKISKSNWIFIYFFLLCLAAVFFDLHLSALLIFCLLLFPLRVLEAKVLLDLLEANVLLDFFTGCLVVLVTRLPLLSGCFVFFDFWKVFCVFLLWSMSDVFSRSFRSLAISFRIANSFFCWASSFCLTCSLFCLASSFCLCFCRKK